MVFVGSRDGAIYGLDAATGSRRWRVSHHGSWVIGSPAVHGDKVFVGSSDGHFVQALEPETGRELWHRETGANILASPLVVGNSLLIATARTDASLGDLLALNPDDGTTRWQLRLDEASNSSPVALDGELYLGTEAGTVLAVHQVSPVIPRLAVFYDSSLTGDPATPGGRLAAEYFRELGYAVLTSDSLAAFFRDRIGDSVPSAVVFAMDILPSSVAPVLADTVLLTRYLKAGGKIVSFSAPLGSVVRDSTGKVLGDDPKRMEQLLGIPAAALDYDEDLAAPTPAGRNWGVSLRLRGDYPMSPEAVTHVLATNPNGRATAWVKEYRTGTFRLRLRAAVGFRRVGRAAAADPRGHGIRASEVGEMTPADRSLASAVMMALGLALGGWFIGHGFASGRASDRYVEVKGLAEREVTADLALWPLRYVSTGNDLTAAQAQITRNTRQVFAFLNRNGIDTTAVQLQALEVSDAFANRFPGERAGPPLCHPANGHGAIGETGRGHGRQPAGERAGRCRSGSLLQWRVRDRWSRPSFSPG